MAKTIIGFIPKAKETAKSKAKADVEAKAKETAKEEK